MLLIVLLSAVRLSGVFAVGRLARSRGGNRPRGFVGIAIALALSLVNYGLRFVRWQKYLALLGPSRLWPESLRIYIAGFGLTILPGKAGETIRSVFLNSMAVSYPESLAAYFSPSISSNLISMLSAGRVGLWAYPQAKPLVVILGAVILAVLVVLQQTQMAEGARGLCAKALPARALARLVAHGIEIVLHSGRCFRLHLCCCRGIALGVVRMGRGRGGFPLHHAPSPR